MLPVQRQELLYAWLHQVLHTLGCTSLALLSRPHSAQWTMAMAPARHRRWRNDISCRPQHTLPSHLMLQCICSAMCAITFQVLHDIVIVVIVNDLYHTGIRLGLPTCKRTNRNENVLAISATKLMQSRLTISNMLRHHHCDSPVMFWTHAGVLPFSGTI